MIVEIITQTHLNEAEFEFEWLDPSQYRYWRQREAFLIREGRLLKKTIVNNSPSQRTITMHWRDWDSYLDRHFDVGSRPIMDLMYREELFAGIESEVAVIEVPDVL